MSFDSVGTQKYLCYLVCCTNTRKYAVSSLPPPSPQLMLRWSINIIARLWINTTYVVTFRILNLFIRLSYRKHRILYRIATECIHSNRKRSLFRRSSAESMHDAKEKPKEIFWLAAIARKDMIYVQRMTTRRHWPIDPINSVINIIRCTKFQIRNERDNSELHCKLQRRAIRILLVIFVHTQHRATTH